MDAALQDFFDGYEEVKSYKKAFKTEEAVALLNEMDNDLSYMDVDDKPAKKNRMIDELQATFSLDREDAQGIFDDWSRVPTETTGEATCGDIEKEYHQLVAEGFSEKAVLVRLAGKYGFTAHEVSYMVQ
jgi:hypothetical protein